MTAEENLTKTREELHAFIERLPLKQLETITSQVKIELQKLANSPEMQEAESRFKTIAKHLWTCIQTGEHAVITDVHNFLVARGKIVPFTPSDPAPTQDGNDPAATPPKP